MGVPFNFTCVGVGNYVCFRCGSELFGSDSKVQLSSLSTTTDELASVYGHGPIFNKALSSDSIVRIPDASNAHPSMSQIKIACGKCGTHLGFEHLLTTTAVEGNVNAGDTTFFVPSRHLRFVQSTRCAVPLSFLF